MQKPNTQTTRWHFDDSKPFPEREFYQEVERSYGDWGGIYDDKGNPVVGCNEYMIFKDRETAELIVKAVNLCKELAEWDHEDPLNFLEMRVNMAKKIIGAV